MQVSQLQNQQSSLVLAQNSNIATDTFLQSLTTRILPDLTYSAMQSTLYELISDANTRRLESTVIPFDEQEDTFYSLMLNGVAPDVYGIQVFNPAQKLNTTTRTLMYLAQTQLGIPLNITILKERFSVTQTSAWAVDVTVAFIITLNHSKSQYQNITQVVTVQIPITQFNDPFYYFNNDDALTKPFTAGSIVGGLTNASVLEEAISNQTYLFFPYGPSFLHRLSNLTNASDYGVTRFIDPRGLPAVNKSHLDFEYINQTWNCNFAKLYEIQAINSTYSDFVVTEKALLTIISPQEYEAQRSSGTDIACDTGIWS
jgi:hypothetical protein